MLHRGSRVKGTLVQGLDGDLGKVDDLYFDDRQWKVSHLTLDPEPRLNSHPVLMAPSCVERTWDVVALPTVLSRDDVRRSPDAASARMPMDRTVPGGSHLRSLEELKGFHLQATDGEIGHVDDLLIDQDSWRISYLLVDTSNWPGGKWVGIPPTALTAIDWDHGTVEVAMSRDAVKHSPPVDSLAVPSAETMPPFVFL